MLKVALVGCAPTWKDAPYGDSSWDIWAHASCQPLGLPRVTRWFDLHQVDVWRQGKVWYRAVDGIRTYVGWLASRPEPVTMQQHYPLVPTSEAYPLREIVEAFGIVPAAWGLTPDDPRWWALVKDRSEFSSTVSYMLALALWQQVDELALYGIDFAGKDVAGIERRYQRPGAKYWVGVARGLGIPVTVAPGSWFTHQEFLYGYDQTPLLQEA